MENQSWQSFHHKQVRKKADLQIMHIVKAKLVTFFSSKTVHNTALLCSFSFYPFDSSSSALLQTRYIGSDAVICYNVLGRVMVKIGL